jgi:hypothetical protein
MPEISPPNEWESILAESSVETDDDGGSSGSGEPALTLPFPFEVFHGGAGELTPTTDDFWTDQSFLRVNWRDPLVRWGKWGYDVRTRQLTHALTQRSFSLSRLDSPGALLRAITSLLIQPNGDVAQFYHLASGALKFCHNKSWDSFWGQGERLVYQPQPNPPKLSKKQGGDR